MSRNPEGSPTPYSGAEISTHAQYEYGYFEARMRTPRGGGLVSGVFTFARPGGSESWHEIDIEILGRNPRQMEVARWFKGHSNGGARKPLWFDSSEDFHTYGFEWTPGAVRWYVDNHLVEETGTDQQPIPHGPQNLVINLWISRKMRSWVGEINPDEAPWRLTVSCVAQAARYTGRTLCPDR
jgi:beta-glucanase (GH16 family)